MASLPTSDEAKHSNVFTLTSSQTLKIHVINKTSGDVSRSLEFSDLNVNNKTQYRYRFTLKSDGSLYIDIRTSGKTFREEDYSQSLGNIEDINLNLLVTNQDGVITTTSEVPLTLNHDNDISVINEALDKLGIEKYAVAIKKDRFLPGAKEAGAGELLVKIAVPAEIIYVNQKSLKNTTHRPEQLFNALYLAMCGLDGNTTSNFGIERVDPQTKRTTIDKDTGTTTISATKAMVGSNITCDSDGILQKLDAKKYTKAKCTIKGDGAVSNITINQERWLFERLGKIIDQFHDLEEAGPAGQFGLLWITNMIIRETSDGDLKNAILHWMSKRTDERNLPLLDPTCAQWIASKCPFADIDNVLNICMHDKRRAGTIRDAFRSQLIIDLTKAGIDWIYEPTATEQATPSYDSWMRAGGMAYKTATEKAITTTKGLDGDAFESSTVQTIVETMLINNPVYSGEVFMNTNFGHNVADGIYELCIIYDTSQSTKPISHFITNAKLYDEQGIAVKIISDSYMNEIDAAAGLGLDVFC